MKPGNSILSSYGTTIFEVMSRLAVEHNAVNLGQGFPEGLEPPSVIAAAARAVTLGPHQYPSMMGIPALRQAVADSVPPAFQKLNLQAFEKGYEYGTSLLEKLREEGEPEMVLSFESES